MGTRAPCDTRRVPALKAVQPAGDTTPDLHRRGATSPTTKAESPRPRNRLAIDAAERSIKSLESSGAVSGEILVSKHSVDSRCDTEQRVRFARGTSSKDGFEREPTVEMPTTEVPRTHVDEHTSQTGLQLASFAQSRSSWLGVVVTQPEVGARIMIGTPKSNKFTVTSPVARIITRDDGVLVQTKTNNRYFVAHGGDVYLVRRVG